ncbi:acid protease [Plenodomus tracheiphilus IPT5]|uniref:Acid protease n=1 Tax=Plenodomus tracheiphilus IPT5 TaxID=1408161 RepID=A0A6A7B7K5_9PLEO|nr:acid protease [Plenodomus tracheiphilus IPT5]
MLFEKRAATATLLPEPANVPSSRDFDGDDGKWSTFHINIGDDGTGNGQNFKVLISTSSGLTVVPKQANWCDLECAKGRGVQLFEGTTSLGLETAKSKTWEEAGIYDIPLPDWFTANLTLNSSGQLPGGVFGRDYVAPGQTAAGTRKSPKQFVVAYPEKDFYMGWLGLAAGESGVTNGSLPNFLDNLVSPDDPAIPSRSFGYSAGAHYRNDGNGVPGSLVLGGFDRSRFKGEGVSINMPSASNNTLIVGVQSILYAKDAGDGTSVKSFTEKEGGFMADIDSTVPYLILPDDICGYFADEFQLTYNEDLRYYLVSDAAHARNLRQNPTMSFKIGISTQDSASKYATITLPYAAFDWQLSPPKANETTQYFPIRRSDGGKFVLGRTFLQETYLVVDYEHINFTVAQAVLEDIPPSKIVPIFPNDYVPPTSNDGDEGLAAGAIAGIVVGIVVAFLIAGVAAFLFMKRRRNSNEKKLDHEQTSEIDTTYAGNEVKYRRVSELTGSELQSPKDSAAGFYSADHKSFPPISEMSPDSTPAELYSPPPEEREPFDYFIAGRVRGRGATRDRDSSGNNTSRTPIAELSGEDAVRPALKEKDRSPSDNSLKTNIDEVLANKRSKAVKATSIVMPGEPASGSEVAQAKSDVGVNVGPNHDDLEQQRTTERRPSHARGLSDTTIQSDSTAVSQPTPEELERWASSGEEGLRRPMSP